MSITSLRAGIIGTGFIAPVHIEALRRIGVQVTAVCGSTAGARATAEKWAIPEVYGDYDYRAMYASPNVDVVHITSPNKLHVEHSVKCIEAGIPQLLEKPIASTVAEGEELVKIVERKVARVLIGHHRAHSPIMAKAKQVIDSGVLGRLVGVMGSATFLKPDHYFEDAPWRKQAGAGPILLNMIHEVHNLRMLCGDIAAVQAFSSHAVREFPVEDTVAISLRFANGALGTFLLSDTAACPRSWEQTSQENKAYPTYDDEDCYTITGTNGCLSIPTMRIKTYPRPEDRSWWKPFEVGVVGMVRDDPIKHQMEHFGAVVRGEAAPIVTALDGLKNLRITEAIVAAARTGSLVATA